MGDLLNHKDTFRINCFSWTGLLSKNRLPFSPPIYERINISYFSSKKQEKKCFENAKTRTGGAQKEIKFNLSFEAAIYNADINFLWWFSCSLFFFKVKCFIFNGIKELPNEGLMIIGWFVWESRKMGKPDERRYSHKVESHEILSLQFLVLYCAFDIKNLNGNTFRSFILDISNSFSLLIWKAK